MVLNRRGPEDQRKGGWIRRRWLQQPGDCVEKALSCLPGPRTPEGTGHLAPLWEKCCLGSRARLLKVQHWRVSQKALVFW